MTAAPFARALLACAALLIAVGLASCARDRDDDDDDQRRGTGEHAATEVPAAPTSVSLPPAVLQSAKLTMAKAVRSGGGEAVSALGELSVNQDAYVEVASPVAARVTALHAGPGDVVKSGAPLLEVVSPEIGNARAALIAAEVRATAAVQARDRKRALSGEKIVAARELQDAEAGADEAQAALSSAKAALTALGITADATSSMVVSTLLLRAPIGGTVLSRDAARGAQVAPEKTLVRIADLKQLWLNVHAWERDAVRVRVGKAARISFPSLPGRVFAGTVAYVGAEVDAVSKTIPVRVVVDNADGVLRPGMSGAALLPTADDGADGGAVSVPMNAVQRVGEAWAVFVPQAAVPGAFDIRTVGRGREQLGLLDVTGLDVGVDVVVDGAFLLKAEVEKRTGGGDDDDH